MAEEDLESLEETLAIVQDQQGMADFAEAEAASKPAPPSTPRRSGR